VREEPTQLQEDDARSDEPDRDETDYLPEQEIDRSVPEVVRVLPLNNTVVYPGVLTSLLVGKESSIALVDDAIVDDRLLGLFAIRPGRNRVRGAHDLFEVGTGALIQKMVKTPDNKVRLLVQGFQKLRLESIVEQEPYLRGRVKAEPESCEDTIELSALRRTVIGTFQQIVSFVPYLPDELVATVEGIEDSFRIAYLVAGSLRMPLNERQEILNEPDVGAKLRRLLGLLEREVQIFEASHKIHHQVQDEVGRIQREHYLRQQLKAIQEELGELDEGQAEVQEFEEKVAASDLPEEVRDTAERELKKFRRLTPASAEYSVVRTYLDWLLTLPWRTGTENHLDIASAHRILEEDHYDLEKVKERILEYLAVRKLKADMKGPILCFVGPPGVGKTSLGQSIARAMGRRFIRMSLGGMRDEAEIRGHRRTYVGALPGRIILGIRNAGSNNPVFMLDEVDKIGMDFRGDPASALLEVLDPEQNHTFRDHYLDLDFDLSHVMFIATANLLEPVPGPLRDRMEVLQLSGYSEEEKLHIARRFLVPRQTAAHGLGEEDLRFSDGALRTMITRYTKEAGLRNLEREIASTARKVARRIAEGKAGPFPVEEENVDDFLGPPRFYPEVARRCARPGVATGLAWTAAGGEILFVEAVRMKGSGGLSLTGQLGEVMKESALAALSFIRANALLLGVDPDFHEHSDIHIHVPAGAIPKDGPSAGITMATALVSLLSDRQVRNDLALTGEVTLTGDVLPVGGIKEKVLAGVRAGIHTFVLPFRNATDTEDLPEHIRERVTIEYVGRLEEVFALALLPPEKGTGPGRKVKATAPGKGRRTGSGKRSSAAGRSGPRAEGGGAPHRTSRRRDR
jgi:ATP-dependent Lon protease